MENKLSGYKFVTDVSHTQLGAKLRYVVDLPNGETKLCDGGKLFKVTGDAVYLRDGDAVWAVKMNEALFYQLDELLNNVELQENKVDELNGKLNELENTVDEFKIYLHNLKKN